MRRLPNTGKKKASPGISKTAADFSLPKPQSSMIIMRKTYDKRTGRQTSGVPLKRSR